MLMYLTFEGVLTRYGYRFTDEDYRMFVGRSLAQSRADLAERVRLGPLDDFSEEWYAVSFGPSGADGRRSGQRPGGGLR